MGENPRKEGKNQCLSHQIWIIGPCPTLGNLGGEGSFVASAKGMAKGVDDAC